MFENLKDSMQLLYQQKIIEYFENLYEHPLKLVASILDVVIVIYLIYKAVKLLKDTRAWQLLKGIAILIILTFLSRCIRIWNFKLHIIICYDVSEYLY